MDDMNSQAILFHEEFHRAGSSLGSRYNAFTKLISQTLCGMTCGMADVTDERT